MVGGSGYSSKGGMLQGIDICMQDRVGQPRVSLSVHITTKSWYQTNDPNGPTRHTDLDIQIPRYQIWVQVWILGWVVYLVPVSVSVGHVMLWHVLRCH